MSEFTEIGPNRLRRNSLGLVAVTFMVISAAAPLTGVAGAMPLAFLLGVTLLLLLLGCILDATTIILVIIPVVSTAAKALGIDLVHFGVVAVVNCMIGLITPPYGMLLFVINGTTGIPLIEMIREIVPFLIALLFALVLTNRAASTVPVVISGIAGDTVNGANWGALMGTVVNCAASVNRKNWLKGLEMR